MSSSPPFRDREFLTRHIREILAFYAPNIVDPRGGLRQNFLDDGTAFDDSSKHLVSSCRMVFNYCVADRHIIDSSYRRLWRRGLDFVQDTHRRKESAGYVWAMKGDQLDQTNHCYGLAFVMLMYATSLAGGDAASKENLYATWTLLEDRFWQADAGLYADEISADWKHLSPYRGQNANMHMCEALLAAFVATRDEQFLDRSYALAHKVVVELSADSEGLIWEHYNEDLTLNWDYNKEDPRNLYRPWGYQPGHHAEWSKLLLLLYEQRPESWLRERAISLFDRALSIGWDDINGGIFYGFDPAGNICDSDKYFWVQAESFAAAALLAGATDDARYWRWYDRIWEYCWRHFVDHEHGAWFRILTSTNEKMDSQKSIAGAKCDYHTIGACVTVIEHACNDADRD